jgi:serine protease DegQ
MRRLWLIFAQTVTVGLAVLFVVSTLKPEWLGKAPAGTSVVALQESAPAARRAATAVVSRGGEEGAAVGGAYLYLAEDQGAS